MAEWKEIPIAGKTVEFGEDQAPAKREFVEVELEDVTSSPEPQEQVLEQPVLPVEQKKDEKKSRAKARIKQLLEQNREKDHLLEKERLELATLRKQLIDTRKEDKTSLKSRLEANIAMLTKQMTEAIKSGDADASVVYNDELIDAKMELASINYELKNQPESVPVTNELPQQQRRQEIPEAALDWINDHPEFKTDEIFHNFCISINNQLLREGYDASDDEFYTELNARASKRFPEMFGVQVQNDVQLNQVTKPTSSPIVAEDVKEPTQTSKVRIVEQTVSGSSRPSATVSKSRKTSVELSPADIAQAERWGLSLEQMARRILHSEQNKRQDGYVPIMLPNKQ